MKAGSIVQPDPFSLVENIMLVTAPQPLTFKTKEVNPPCPLVKPHKGLTLTDLLFPFHSLAAKLISRQSGVLPSQELILLSHVYLAALPKWQPRSMDVCWNMPLKEASGGKASTSECEGY